MIKKRTFKPSDDPFVAELMKLSEQLGVITCFTPFPEPIILKPHAPEKVEIKMKTVPRRYNDKCKWEKLIQDGENPKGLTAQTPNGTSHWKGTGWNQYTFEYTMEQGEPTPVSPAGRSNRTGE